MRFPRLCFPRVIPAERAMLRPFGRCFVCCEADEQLERSWGKHRAWGTGPEVPNGQVRKLGAKRRAEPLRRTVGAGSAQRSEEGTEGPWSEDNAGDDSWREH